MAAVRFLFGGMGVWMWLGGGLVGWNVAAAAVVVEGGCSIVVVE